MDESSFETLGYLTPEDQVPCQNEKADFEDNKRESWYSFTDGSLPSRKEDFVNGYKENSWENIDPEDSFPNVKSIVELDTTPENCFPEEDDNWTLKLPSMPDESSVTCPTGTRNVFYVTRDGHSSMEVEKHIGNRYNLASDIQDLVAEAPCSFMQRREVVDKNLSGEAILCHQLGSRTSDKVLREEQGMYANKNNYWSFFTTNLSDEELQPSSENYSQPYFDSWPEGPHKFVCAQRPKKDRSHKLTCPNSRDQFIKLISTSEGTARPGSSPEILIEEKLLTENNLSGPNETTDLFMETETNTFSSCLPQLDSPMNTVESTKAKKKRQERIFSLAPNFNILAQRYINAKEIEEHGLNIILEDEKNRISEVNNKEDNKQKVVTFDHHSLWFYLEIIRECPLNISKQFYSHYLLFSRLGHAVYFYKNPITSLVLHYISSFWMVSFTNNKTFLTFKSLTRVDNRLTDVGLISSEILSRQPDTLCSLRGISDLNFLNERFNENLKRWEESKPLQCLPVERLQDLKNTDLNFLGLPLPKAFAFQLVKLFGSPGVPMEKTEEDWLKMRIP